MPPIWKPPEPNDIIERYRSGESCQALGSSYGVKRDTIAKYLSDRGIQRRSAGETRRLTIANASPEERRRLLPKTIKWEPTVVDLIISRYESGESAAEIGRDQKVSGSTISELLRSNGVNLRSRGDAPKLRWDRMPPEERARQNAAIGARTRKVLRDFWDNATPDERQARVEAAHAATATRGRPFDELCAAALARQETGLRHPYEILLAEWLSDRGYESFPQLAVGPYNSDLTIGTVAVEVGSAGWHTHRSRHHLLRSRIQYLFDSGFDVFAVWWDAEHPLTEACADHVVAFIEKVGSNPPSVREYGVIGGDGRPLTAPSLQFNEFANPVALKGTAG